MLLHDSDRLIHIMLVNFFQIGLQINLKIHIEKRVSRRQFFIPLQYQYAMR